MIIIGLTGVFLHKGIRIGGKRQRRMGLQGSQTDDQNQFQAGGSLIFFKLILNSRHLQFIFCANFRNNESFLNIFYLILPGRKRTCTEVVDCRGTSLK